MKRLLLLAMALVLMIPVVAAQDEEITLVPFESGTFSVAGVIPEGWAEVSPGVYSRAASADDFVLIAVQSAPLAVDALLPTLLQQLGLEEAPEVTEQIETEAFTWDVYEVDLEQQGLEVGVTLALAQGDGQTVIILLQSTQEEHEALQEAVFWPVLESIAPLEAEATEDLPYIEEEVTFSHGDITLAGTLTLPEGEGQHPAVILLSGSGAQNRDEQIGDFRIFRQIADHLTRNGIAVLRFDDRGAGNSTGDYMSSTAEDFAVDASAAVDFLLTRDDIDPAQIGLLGHSEGGIVAPIAAGLNENVSFAILMAAPAAPGIDVLLAQYESILQTEGNDPEVIAALLPTQRAILEAITAEDDEALVAALTAQYEAIPEDLRGDFGTLEDYLAAASENVGAAVRYLIAYNPAEDMMALEIPVLAVYASLDVQVLAEQNVPVMEELLAENPDATVVTIESANHLFQAAETGALSEYETLEPVLMPEYLDIITDWLLERLTLAE